MSGQERERVLLRCKQYNKKVSQGIPGLLNKLHLAGSGRRDTCPLTAGTLTVVYAPWTAVNTQNKRFCKKKGLKSRFSHECEISSDRKNAQIQEKNLASM